MYKQVNYELFLNAQDPILKHLRNTPNYETIQRLAIANKTFNGKLTIKNRQQISIKVLEKKITKAIVLLAVLQMAYMYDLRSQGSRTETGYVRLGDTDTIIYIYRLGSALINYVGIHTHTVDIDFLLRNKNDEFSRALLFDYKYMLKQFYDIMDMDHYPGKFSGLALYKYLYKYKGVYNQYMRSINKFNFTNTNNHMKREFTLKQAHLNNRFSNANMNRMLNNLNMPRLTNASTVDRVADMESLAMRPEWLALRETGGVRPTPMWGNHPNNLHLTKRVTRPLHFMHQYPSRINPNNKEPTPQMQAFLNLTV
jgi:hypothetical protein